MSHNEFKNNKKTLQEYLNESFIDGSNDFDEVIEESKVTFEDLYVWYAKNTKSNGKYKADKYTEFHSCGSFVNNMLVDTDNECIIIDTIKYDSQCLNVSEAIKIVLDKYKFNTICDFPLINVFRNMDKMVLGVDSIKKLESQIEKNRYEMLIAEAYTSYDSDKDNDKDKKVIEFATKRIKKLTE